MKTGCRQPRQSNRPHDFDADIPHLQFIAEHGPISVRTAAWERGTGTDALNDWLKGRMCELGYVRLKEVETSAGRSIYLWLTPAGLKRAGLSITPIGVLPNGNTQML